MPISQVFDLVVGTSSGGITTLALATPDKDNKPKFSAKKVVELYNARAAEIFSASWQHRLHTMGGLLGPKYDSIGLRNVVHSYVGNTMMDKALMPTIITGYYLGGQVGVEFSSQDARRFPGEKNCRMEDVAMATSAAPIYFDSVDINFSWGTLYSVADGGVYKNNPALVAYINAKQLYPGREIDIYSIGTGRISAEELKRQLKGRGLLAWLAPIYRHIQIGDSNADNSFLHKLLNEDGEQNFFRLNVDVNRAHRSMDDSAQVNLDYLRQKGLEAASSEMFNTMLTRIKAGLAL